MARLLSVVRRNSGSMPSGELTVHLADGRQVKTTPAFIDANGKLFSYDDYIKGALINRFPKDDSIPFYAFSLNQKADALYDKLGKWAKGGGSLVDDRTLGVRSGESSPESFRGRLERAKGDVLSDDFSTLTTFESVFPTRDMWDGSPSTDVSTVAKHRVREIYRMAIALHASPSLGLISQKDSTALKRLAAVTFPDKMIQYLYTSSPESLVKLRVAWDSIASDPAAKALLISEAAAADDASQAAWAARFKGAPATPQSGNSASSSQSQPASASSGAYPTTSQEVTGMQYAQAMALNDAIFGRKNNPRPRLTGLNVARRR